MAYQKTRTEDPKEDSITEGLKEDPITKDPEENRITDYPKKHPITENPKRTQSKTDTTMQAILEATGKYR